MSALGTKARGTTALGRIVGVDVGGTFTDVVGPQHVFQRVHVEPPVVDC